MKTKFTLSDIGHCYTRIELADGIYAKIDFLPDSSHGAPWEECDGHGPVSEWTTRDNRPGERVLSSDRRSKRYYDFAEAVKIAKRDGWDALPYKTGTKGQQAVRAVEADFQSLSEWCNDQWSYVGVCVSLHHEDGKEIASDSLWGVESRGDYSREVAAEILSILASDYAERTEHLATLAD